MVRERRKEKRGRKEISIPPHIDKCLVVDMVVILILYLETKTKTKTKTKNRATNFIFALSQ